VYKVECTVNPEGSTAEIKFTSPVHQSVSQEIPIVCILKMYLKFRASDKNIRKYLRITYSVV
jgi:hypothetical protein